MQDIMTAIRHKMDQLENKRSELYAQLRQLHWEDDQISIQILQSDLDHLEKQLVIASFVNCTPHALTIEGLGELRPSGILPRVATELSADLPISGVRVRRKINGAVTGLPDPVEGLTFIVSGMVRDALSSLPVHLQRSDVFAPDTGPDAIRNEKGHIVAVRGLVQ